MPHPPDSHATLSAWLRLAYTPGIGPVGARKLLSRFGGPIEVLAAAASHDEPAGHRQAQALLARDVRVDAQIERALDWARRPDCHLLTLTDPAYPASLLHLPDPPLVLHVRGQLAALREATLAIVGARNATAGGVTNARRFARELACASWVVASGLARGVDAGAHEGALDASGLTVAVLGTGADVIYPSQHADLADRIAAQGAILSELPLGTAPQPGLFPRRNRLIAGLSRGVLVIEAALRSGSLITARLAADFGREVFALPGSIHSPLARGCHALIRQGAHLVETLDDIVGEFPAYTQPTGAADPAPRQDKRPDTRVMPEHQGGRKWTQPDAPDTACSALGGRLLAAIGHEPIHPDTLANVLGLGVAQVSAQLVLLELEGRLARQPDGRVHRVVLSG